MESNDTRRDAPADDASRSEDDTDAREDTDAAADDFENDPSRNPPEELDRLRGA